MKTKLAAVGFAAALSLATFSGAMAAKPDGVGPKEKVTICHATESDKNPYVLITVNANSLRAHNPAHHNPGGDYLDQLAGEGCPSGGDEQ